MNRVRGHYGVVPNDRTRPRVTLRPKPDGTLNPPASVDWYSGVPASSWLMLGNGPDNSIPNLPNFGGCGDCTVAGMGHMIDQVEWYAQSHTPATVTGAQAVAAYSAITGYNPANGSNDNGAELQQVLQWWTQNGFAGYTPSGFAEIDITNVALTQTCIDYFGAVYSGFAVPAIFETQFDNGQPWDVPRGRAGSQIVGGHCVPIIGYDATYWYVLTWGAVQKVTYAALAKYWGTQEGGEGWVAVVPQLMEASGVTPSGLDTATANADFQSLTGSTEAPFPVVVPNPTPAPTPTPTPTPPASDAVALLTSLQSDLTLAADQATALAQQIASFLQANPSGNVPPHVHGH